MAWAAFCHMHGPMGIEAEAARDPICNNTLTPPKQTKMAVITKSGFSMEKIPVVSSSSPDARIETGSGKRANTHRWRNPDATAARITQPQTSAMEPTARRTASGMETDAPPGRKTPRLRPGNRAARSRAVSNWIRNSTAVSANPNNEPRTPNRNPGPQKLHSPSIRAASVRSRFPDCTAWAMHAAPTGNPPAQPRTKTPALPDGKPSKRLRKAGEKLRSPGTSIALSTSRGKSPGIKTSRHSVSAVLTESAAQRLSRISSTAPRSSGSVPFKFHHLA